MNKDVIYIDVEDDVTAIIGKVKDAKEKIVALVPPKRIGVLQSTVNLRILQRTAKTAGKHLVLITNDQSLIPLAAGASIPVAKNLQSKPEIPEIAALKVDDDDDIIDGGQLPVGEHAASAEPARPSKKARIPVSTGDADPKTSRALPPKDGESPRKPKAGAGKVPNFNAFRKKLIIIIVLIIALIGFFVWAIWFAPKATVEITAKTSNVNVNTSVMLGAAQQTDASKGTMRTVQVEEKQEAAVDFEATGTEEQGEAAGGTVTLSKSSPNSKKVPIGTGFSNGDCTFVTRTEVTVPGASPSWNGSGFTTVAGTVDVKVKATAIGEQCNLSARKYDSTVDGVSAKGGDMTGGVKKVLKIVTQADVQKASEQIASQNNGDVKTKLQQKFGKDVKAIDSSLRTIKSDVVATPQVGQEAPEGKAKLVSTVTYAMDGVASADLESFIKAAASSKLSKENDQRVYETNTSSAQLADFAANDTGGTATLSATTQVGPQIKDDDIKTRVKGKRFSDIQSDLKTIQGVDDVDVKLSPFWVSKVPNDEAKITVKFKLINTAKNGS